MYPSLEKVYLSIVEARNPTDTSEWVGSRPSTQPTTTRKTAVCEPPLCLIPPRSIHRRPKNRGLAPLTEKFNPATLWIWRRCPDYDDDQTIKRRLSSARDSVDRFEAAFGCDHPVEQTFPLVRTSDQAAEQTFPLVGTF